MVCGIWIHQLQIVAVEADEVGVRQRGGHTLEGKADDDGGVEAYAKLQEQEAFVLCTLHELLVAVGLMVPVLTPRRNVPCLRSEH